MTTSTPTGYVPPPYPYDKLDELKPLAAHHPGGLIDLSIGTPRDAPPAAVLTAMARSGSERGYPPSIGLLGAREAAAAWLERCFGAHVSPSNIAATIGTKEFVVSTPQYLHLRSPERDTVLYPAISYPSYAMGAELAGLRAVPVAVDAAWNPMLDSIDPADADRAVCLWVNSPGNPAGAVDDLAAAAAWGRHHDVPVLSDECYIEFTWGEPPEGRFRAGSTIVADGLDGVLALHSLSKRSNFAGGRFGFYAGDPDLVHFISEIRKHAGFMVPGPVQHGAIAALDDDEHVDAQRQRYWQRLEFMAGVLRGVGLDVELPAGGFYLWVPAPGGDAWSLTRWLAEHGGLLVSPGEFYGEAGAGHVRVALVGSLDELKLVADRLASAPTLVA
jgi:succinyldiaminopimelate transaminase